MDATDYLFLGNYIDRGTMSLEVIFTLLALKCKYPKSIYLLRGSHEDITINRHEGFGLECQTKLGESLNSEDSIFQTVNRLFEYLPLAAIIEDNILCIHSGIGENFKNVS